ncbi:MAG: trypsin-like peptidase domain-containing protein [Pseudomonadota bacterium]
MKTRAIIAIGIGTGTFLVSWLGIAPSCTPRAWALPPPPGSPTATAAHPVRPPLWSTLPPSTAARPAALADLADRARPAVVHVRGITVEESGSGTAPAEGDGDRVSIGTGFIVNKDGTVVTNDHVVRNVTRLRVRLYDGREFPACVLGSDAPTDIALLRVDAKRPLPVLPLGDSDAVRVGEPVIAIGNPFGFNNSVTAGIVSAKERVVDRATMSAPASNDAYSFFIQTDASINLGNSGGPLIDARGQVIGVSAAFWAGHPMQPAQGIGFAIPINMAKALLPRLRDAGSAPRSFLGVDAQPLDASLAAAMNLPSTRGALLASVEKGSPAEECGVEPGDVILTWGTTPIATSEDLKIHAQLSIPGSRVRLEIVRGGKHIERTVTMRAAPTRAAGAPARHPSSCALALGADVGRPEEIAVTELPPERAGTLPGGKGVAVSEVPAQSAAADAGLRIGDVILRVGNGGVRTARDLATAIKGHAGDMIPILVRRAGYDFWTALRRR